MKPLEDDEEQEWEEHISNKTFTESGFGLLNQLHLAVVDCFFRELRDTEEGKPVEAKENGQEVTDDQLVIADVKYFEEGESQHWPELLRIVMKSKRFSFNPLSDQVRKICDEQLSSCVPETYSQSLSYEQKLELLETLVDGVHDLDDFKNFLNQRLEERSSYNKQKMEIYAEIKTLEQQK